MLLRLARSAMFCATNRRRNRAITLADRARTNTWWRNACIWRVNSTWGRDINRGGGVVHTTFGCSFVRLFVRAFVCLFVCLFVGCFWLFVCLFVCLFVRLFVCLLIKIQAFIHLFVCLFIQKSAGIEKY